LAATSLFVILLPILYVLLIVATASVVAFHAVHNLTIFDWDVSGSGGFLIKLISYVGPIIAGSAMVFFMAKPFFSRRESRSEPVEINESDEPIFFAFVRAICTAVNSPMPSKIYVDTQVNASASLLKGVDGFFGGKLALTVGTPLIHGMSSREIAGILAHEFGHFSQGTGMRLSFVVRTINWWFQRIVFERDEWDRRLEDATKTDFRIAIVFHFARLMVWLTRKVMWCFMTVSHLSSMYLLRQMEYDADRYEIRLAGSSQFPKTARHLMILGAASDKAHNSISHSLSEGSLPDDFGMLASHYQSKLDSEVIKQIEDHIKKEETSIWSTHPSDRDRNANARSEAAAGVFKIDRPMTDIFTDLHRVSKITTVHLYRTVLNNSFNESQLTSSAETIRKSEELTADYDAFTRFFGDSISIATPLSLRKFGEIPVVSPIEILADIQKRTEETANVNSQFDTVFGSLIDIQQGKALLKAGYTIKDNQFGFTGTTIEAAKKAELAKREELERSRSALSDCTSLFIQRIKSSLSTEPSKLDPQLKENCLKLMKTASLIESHSVPYQKLLEEFNEVKIIISQDTIENEKRWNTIVELCESMYDELTKLYKELTAIPYPFEHTKANVSMAEFIIDTVPLKSDHQQIYGASENFISGMAGLYSRVLGRLARHVETHETVIGVSLPS